MNAANKEFWLARGKEKGISPGELLIASGGFLVGSGTDQVATCLLNRLEEISEGRASQMEAGEHLSRHITDGESSDDYWSLPKVAVALGLPESASREQVLSRAKELSQQADVAREEWERSRRNPKMQTLSATDARLARELHGMERAAAALNARFEKEETARLEALSAATQRRTPVQELHGAARAGAALNRKFELCASPEGKKALGLPADANDHAVLERMSTLSASGKLAGIMINIQREQLVLLSAFRGFGSSSAFKLTFLQAKAPWAV